MALCSEHSLSCANVPVTIFNFLFFMSGVSLILLGLWVLIDSGKVHLLNLLMADDESRYIILIISYAFIIIGTGNIFLVSMGCYTIQKKPSFMSVYLTLLVALQFVEITAVLVTLLGREAMLAGLQSRLTDTLNMKYGHQRSDYINRYGNNVFTLDLDYTQYTFKCCGVTGAEDYVSSRWYNKSQETTEPRNVPITCCARPDYEEASAGSPLSVVSRVFHGTVEEIWQNPRVQRESDCQSNKSGARYDKGCLPLLEGWFHSQSTTLVVTLLVPLTLQVFCTVYYLRYTKKLRSGKFGTPTQSSSHSSAGG